MCARAAGMREKDNVGSDVGREQRLHYRLLICDLPASERPTNAYETAVRLSKQLGTHCHTAADRHPRGERR